MMNLRRKIPFLMGSYRLWWLRALGPSRKPKASACKLKRLASEPQYCQILYNKHSDNLTMVLSLCLLLMATCLGLASAGPPAGNSTIDAFTYIVTEHAMKDAPDR